MLQQPVIRLYPACQEGPLPYLRQGAAAQFMLRSPLHKAPATAGGRLLLRELKVTANAMKKGALVSGSSLPGGKADRILRLVEAEHIKPGKGGAYLQTKMVDIVSSEPFRHRFSTSDKVELIELDPAFKAQFLYEADGVHHFMNMDTYDSVEVDSQLLTAESPWLQDGMEVKIRTFEEKALSVTLPQSAAYLVADTESGGKSMKTHTSKPAVLENGEQVDGCRNRPETDPLGPCSPRPLMRPSRNRWRHR